MTATSGGSHPLVAAVLGGLLVRESAGRSTYAFAAGFTGILGTHLNELKGLERLSAMRVLAGCAHFLHSRGANEVADAIVDVMAGVLERCSSGAGPSTTARAMAAIQAKGDRFRSFQGAEGEARAPRGREADARAVRGGPAARFTLQKR